MPMTGITGSSPLATSVPKPLQTPHPRIWVAARDPGTFDWAVGIGASILSTPLAAPAAEIAVLGEKFRKAVADHPEVTRPRFMMQRRTCCYDRPEEAELAVRHSIDYGRSFENLFQNIGTVTNGFPTAVSYESVAGRENYKPENVLKNLMFGTPDEVIGKLLDYEAAGVDQFSLGLSFNLPVELQRKTLDLFSREVLRVAPVLGTEMTRRLVALMPAGRIQAYGKAASVGVNGEIEHASALIHTLRFGNMFREAAQGTTFLSFTNTRNAPGALLALPMIHKTETGKRAHFLTANFQVTDAPGPDELLVAIGASDGSRAHPRIGDRFLDMEEMEAEKAVAR